MPQTLRQISSARSLFRFTQAIPRELPTYYAAAILVLTGMDRRCSWERFCTFAPEPEQRKVGIDARVSIEGICYEVDADLAGEEVVLWW